MPPEYRGECYTCQDEGGRVGAACATGWGEAVVRVARPCSRVALIFAPLGWQSLVFSSAVAASQLLQSALFEVAFVWRSRALTAAGKERVERTVYPAVLGSWVGSNAP